jgi:hypothetical protein
MRGKAPMRLVVLLLVCAVVQLTRVSAAENKTYTRAEAALDLATHFHLPHSDDPHTLYGLLHGVFPGGYDGKIHLSFHDQPCTLEVLIVALVRHMGWNILHYSPKLAEEVRPFVSPEGIPWYGPDPTPRSIPSVVVALEKGLLRREHLGDLRKPLTRADALAYLGKLDNHGAFTAKTEPTRWLTIEECENSHSLLASPPDAAQLLVIPREAQCGDLLAELPNPILDLRAPGLRLRCGPSELNSGRQDYFPLGPLQSTFTASLGLSADSLVHQGEAIYGRVENASPTANAVGVWGAALSRSAKARVWGGFLTAENTAGAQQDAQLVGLEVDVTNKSKPGVTPNASKVGIQVVGIGNRVTNALEIIGAEDGLWENGLNFAQRAIAPDGTVIGLTQPDPVNIGIDFAHTPFGTAAMIVSNNSLLGFCSKQGGLAGMYTDDIGEGSLVLRPGVSGLRVTDNQNRDNLLWLTPQGDLLVKGRVWDVGGEPSRKVERWIIAILAVITCLNTTALVVLLGAGWRRRRARHTQGAKTT